MAGVAGTPVLDRTLHLRQRVGDSSRRTGALGTLLFIWQTDSILAAGIRCAHIQTAVGQSITKLARRWAVNVG